MPYEGPGSRYSTIATKATRHGDPAVEKGHPGIAAKSTQIAPAAVSQANADAAVNIAIGEEFVIMTQGLHEVLVASLAAGAEEGDEVYIRDTDNVLLGSGGSNVGTNEVQTLTVDATGGTFALTFDGQTTAAIPEAATAAAVQAALEALSNIAPGDVTVTGSAGGPYTITFKGAYRDTNVSTITTSAGLLTGGAGTAVIATTTAGVAEIVKFGRISSIDAVTGRALVNLNLRDTF